MEAIGGAVIGGLFSQSAADTQADAATSAAKTSADATKYATDIQKEVLDRTRADQAPWRTGGRNALNKLLQGMGIDVPSTYDTPETQQQIYNRLLPQFVQQRTTQPVSQGGLLIGAPGYWEQQFGQGGQPSQQESITDATGLNAAVQAALSQQSAGQSTVARGADFGTLAKPFSMADYQQDPGYQFRLSEGLKALDRSASARGGLLSGAALKGINRYGQDYASGEYQNAYNRYQSDQANQYNRLASIAGLGQTANNALQTAGQNYAGNVGNLTMGNAANQGNALLSGAAGRVSAYQGMGQNIGTAMSSTGAKNWLSSSSNPLNWGGAGSMNWGGSVQGNPDYFYDL